MALHCNNDIIIDIIIIQTFAYFGIQSTYNIINTRRKSTKDAADAALGKEKLNLEKTKVQIDAQEKGVRLQADKVKEDNKLDLELFKTTRKQ